MIDRLLAGALLSLGLVTAAPAAAQATKVVTITRDLGPTTIQPGEYYTHVLADVPDFNVPSDDNGKKQLGKAILSAFGLGDKTRSLTITLTLTYQGDALPEIPLITYTFDGSKRLTDYQRVHSYLSPAWLVGAANPITAKLNYRYSEQTSYDPKAISDSVSQVIPSDAIVTTISKPFVQSLVGLTTSIFNIAGSRTVTNGDQDDLLPYSGAVGARALTFSIRTPSGVALGDIKLSLVVAPTLERAPIFATAASLADLVKPDTESVSALALDQGGSIKLLLSEVEGLPDYLAMAKDRQDASVRSYCQKATQTLNADQLTVMDRTTVIYQSLIDANFTPDDNHWLLACFTQTADRVALTKARNISFVPVAPPPAPTPDPLGLNWPVPLKDAMGCWITGQTGAYCQQHAPSARTILEAAMNDQVKIGVVELPTIDQSTIQVGRLWTKASLLDAINGKADSFSCFQQGLIVTAGNVPYTLSVSVDGGKITSFQIVKAPPDAAQCLGS